MSRRRRKSKPIAGKTIRFEQDVQEAIAHYASRTGWSDAKCINWLARIGFKSLNGERGFSRMAGKVIDAAHKRHKIEQQVADKLDDARRHEREAAAALRPPKPGTPPEESAASKPGK